MAAKKLLMLVGDYVADYEAMVPFQALLMGRARGPCRLPQQESWRFVAHRHPRFRGRPDLQRKAGHNFALNATFDDIRLEDYDALVIPGGRAPEYIRLNPRVLEIVRHFGRVR